MLTLYVAILTVVAVLLAKGIDAEQRCGIAVDGQIAHNSRSRSSATIHRRTYRLCKKDEPGHWFLFRGSIREYGREGRGGIDSMEFPYLSPVKYELINHIYNFYLVTVVYIIQSPSHLIPSHLSK